MRIFGSHTDHCDGWELERYILDTNRLPARKFSKNFKSKTTAPLADSR